MRISSLLATWSTSWDSVHWAYSPGNVWAVFPQLPGWASSLLSDTCWLPVPSAPRFCQPFLCLLFGFEFSLCVLGFLCHTLRSLSWDLHGLGVFTICKKAFWCFQIPGMVYPLVFTCFKLHGCAHIWSGLPSSLPSLWEEDVSYIFLHSVSLFHLAHPLQIGCHILS